VDWRADHSVTLDLGGKRIVTDRIAFEYLGRFLGNEEVREERYEGQYRGWTWKIVSQTTHAFQTRQDLRDWIDSLYRDNDVAKVSHSTRTIGERLTHDGRWVSMADTLS
jgi:hypothetical protein